MKTVVCGSLTSSKKMLEIAKEIGRENLMLPPFVDDFAKMNSEQEMHNESAKNKIDHDLIKKYFKEIEQSDSILVVNQDRKGVKNYIGGNTLIEMAFAHVLNKKIFLLNPIPDISYSDEIEAMQPIILNNDLTKLKQYKNDFSS